MNTTSTLVRRTPAVVRRRVGTLQRALREAHRDGGFTAAFAEAARLIGELVTRPLHRWHENHLDRSLNLDTRADTGVLHPAVTLLSPPAATFGDAVGYSPIPIHHFERLLRRLPVDNPYHYTFVDLGAGKGRTLILAAEHGFRPVIGVELDRRLSDIARANAAAWAAASDISGAITVVTADAVDYEFPSVPAVIFLFNPFGAGTLASVLDTLERSLKQAPRRTIVAYFNPAHRDVLDRSPALRQIAASRHWVIYESVT